MIDYILQMREWLYVKSIENTGQDFEEKKEIFVTKRHFFILISNHGYGHICIFDTLLY